MEELRHHPPDLWYGGDIDPGSGMCHAYGPMPMAPERMALLLTHDSAHIAYDQTYPMGMTQVVSYPKRHVINGWHVINGIHAKGARGGVNRMNTHRAVPDHGDQATVKHDPKDDWIAPCHK
jgi:hypothetical protein